ncbi:MAG: flavin reductase family protein [Pseudomonadota bacterium]
MSTAFSARDFRTAMGQFATGVTVVTGLAPDGAEMAQPLGFVAQSFVSVSLEPPLIAICPGRQSTSWPLIRRRGDFAVNVLAADQRSLCEGFARSGGDKFSGINWTSGLRGLPLLAGAILQVECSVAGEHEAGDHWIALGAFERLSLLRPDAAPLLFFRGGYPLLELPG